MSLALGSRRSVLTVAVILSGTGLAVWAADAGKPTDADKPVADAQAKPAAPAQPVHPLEPELERARKRMTTMHRDIKDYSCTLVKRERVNGKLMEYEAMFAKIRQQPFSVYLYFLSPADKKGQQAVYIEGRNGGNLIAQPVGLAGKLGPYSLKTEGYLAMQGNRYPITEAGFVNLIRRLLEVGQEDRKHEECVVRTIKNVKVTGGNGDPRICTLTEVTHPVQRDHFRYYMARIYVDDELDIPIRFESYSWPETPGGKPLLLEEYTYTDVKLNNGFTDADFEIRK